MAVGLRERAKDSGAWPENDSTFDNNVAVDFLPLMLSRHGRAPTALRPPAVPFLMAIVFMISKGYFLLVSPGRLHRGRPCRRRRDRARPQDGRCHRCRDDDAHVLLGLLLPGAFVPCVMTEGVSILAVMLVVWALILVSERKRLRFVLFLASPAS